MIGGRDDAAAEVTLGHCLGAIRGFEEILGDLDEEDEEKFVL